MMEAFGLFFVFFGIGACLGLVYVAFKALQLVVAAIALFIVLPALRALKAFLERRAIREGDFGRH